ncbi:type VII secretion-associated serine protease mycosin [Actinoplanes sp. NPDC049681]|uniref:type VII secretion-associated serine protease mycosin n=1 Tax=Actinoplanes sp. NPDC049681 TaxID=3363905 RepID=UPI003794D2B7
MTSVRRAGRIAGFLLAAAGLVGSTATPAAADSIRDRQWYLKALEVSRAHGLSEGRGVTVAVIDTGVDVRHRDLAGAVLPGLDVYPNAKGDGREDLAGHGTEMAGIIAARGHSTSDGVLGIAPAAKILPIRAPIDGYASSGYMREAVAFAKKRGAGVINMSFGTSDDVPLRDAIRAAQAADIVLVAASGNKDAAGDDYPGKYPEVLTVGATDRNGKVAEFSVTGSQVDITAPGVDIATTGIYESGYQLGSGTSQAAALVSGAAALMRAKYPDLSAAEVVHRLTATATDAGAPGRDDSYGYGRLNLLKALTADVPPLATASPSTDRHPAPAKPAAAEQTRRTSPLVFAAGAAVVVLLIGGLVVGLMLRRQR